MLSKEIRICQKKLKLLFSSKKLAEQEFDIAVSAQRCNGCDYFNRNSVSLFSERFSLCQNCSATKNMLLTAQKLDNCILQIDTFIENDYAEVIYNTFSKENPTLITVRTGEEIEWKDAFGDSFKNLSKGLRHSLVGLIEGELRYRLK